MTDFCTTRKKGRRSYSTIYLGKSSVLQTNNCKLFQLLSQKALQFHTRVYWQCLLNEYEDDSFKRVSWKMPPLVDIFLFQEFWEFTQKIQWSCTHREVNVLFSNHSAATFSPFYAFYSAIPIIFSLSDKSLRISSGDLSAATTECFPRARMNQH